MPNPYGLQLSPQVGNGLPGLPRKGAALASAVSSTIDWNKVGNETFANATANFAGTYNYNVRDAQFSPDGMRVFWQGQTTYDVRFYYADLAEPYRFDKYLNNVSIYTASGTSSVYGNMLILPNGQGFLACNSSSALYLYKYNTPYKPESGTTFTYMTMPSAPTSTMYYMISPDLKTLWLYAASSTYKYVMAVPGDLSTAAAPTSVAGNIVPFANGAQGCFSADGMFWLSFSAGVIQVYPLTIPFDITTRGVYKNITYSTSLYNYGGVSLDKNNRIYILGFQQVYTTTYEYRPGVVVIYQGA